jgi:hypothetical protein
MSIYGIGAYYENDVSKDFILNRVVGCGWSSDDAPEIHQFIRSLKVGDIVYIKSFSPSSHDLIIKAIGIITDSEIVHSELVECGRNVKWAFSEEIRIKKPEEKNNVRLNTLYEEYNQIIQDEIIKRLIR